MYATINWMHARVAMQWVLVEYQCNNEPQAHGAMQMAAVMQQIMLLWTSYRMWIDQWQISAKIL